MISTVGYWALMGAHQGWSQDRIPRHAIDEVTGLVHVTYENRFLPGIDLLFGGCTAAVIVLLSAFFLQRRQKYETR